MTKRSEKTDSIHGNNDDDNDKFGTMNNSDSNNPLQGCSIFSLGTHV